MSNFRIFSIAIAACFWPALFKLVDAMNEYGNEGAAKVAAGLFLMCVLLAWAGFAAVAIFGDRK